MKVIFLCQLFTLHSLKLLENTYPLTPYKPVGGAADQGCAQTEKYVTLADKKCAGTSSGNVLSASMPLAQGSACEIALTPALKTYQASEDADDLTALKAVADRCCQNIDDDAAGDKFMDGITSLTLDTALPGLAYVDAFVGCGGYVMETEVDDDASVTFYPKMKATGQYASNVGGGCVLSAAETDFEARYKHASKQNVPTLTVKTGVGDGGPSEVMGAATTAGNQADDVSAIEAARTQCTKTGDGFWAAYTHTPSGKTIAAKDVVCGGFCINTGTHAVSFYYPGVCYLINDGSDNTYAVASGSMACYSSLGLAPASADMPKAFNDPKVVNLAGESFEILQTGNFQMIAVSSVDQSLVSVAATIDRAGSRCGATYIQNVTISGEWVKQIGVPKVQVRAAPALPKKVALQVSQGDGEDWLPAAQSSLTNLSSTTAAVTLSLHSLQFDFSVDSHRIVEGEKKTRRFANFLNMNVRGLKQLDATQLRISGLLGGDDHREASTAPECGKEINFMSYVSTEQSTPKHCPIEKCGKKVSKP